MEIRYLDLHKDRGMRTRQVDWVPTADTMITDEGSHDS